MLKTIERVTGQKITIEKLPTVADLRARRLELTRSAIEESLVEAADLERFRVVVDALAGEHDVVEIALAAIKLAHEASATGDDDEEEIPEVKPRGEGRPSGPGGGSSGGRARDPRASRVFVGAGRTMGVRPSDLVGAITGESSVSGREIGAIEVSDRFSLIEVPEARIDEVIAALRSSTIKGKKATVRRDRPGPPPQRKRR
jgi:ATP-dependent RNA helicase DeaD